MRKKKIKYGGVAVLAVRDIFKKKKKKNGEKWGFESKFSHERD